MNQSTFPPSDAPLHVSVFKPGQLPPDKVYCERCQQVIPLSDHAGVCPGMA